ncbi:MAG: DedA family protein [Candidatus Rickettsia vulgarisii]
MNQLEAYLVLFIDSVLGNLAINLDNEIIIHSMLIFNNYSSILIVIIATIASLIAVGINYSLGRILLKVFYRFKTEKFEEKYQLFSQFFAKYYIWIVFLIILPFWGKFIPVMLGFFKIDFLRILSIIAVIKLCYHICVVYNLG